MRYEDAEWRASMRVRLAVQGMGADPDGRLTAEGLTALAPACAAAQAAVVGRRAAGALAWTELPYAQGLARELAEYGRWVGHRFDNLVVVAAGGAASVNTALAGALLHPYWNLLPREARGGPRLFVLDNADPETVSGLLDTLDPTQTLFHIITETDGPPDTLALFMLARRALVNSLGDGYRDHLVVTTHPERGALRSLARQEGYQAWPYPVGLPDRFAALSPVGLVAAAACGLAIHELLAGAAYADETTSRADPATNPALLAAALHWQASQQGHTSPVLWPLAQALTGLTDWLAHLWATSLVKRLDRRGRVVQLGPTPLTARSARDWPGLVQRLVEGPADTLVTFVDVDEYRREAPLPELRTRGSLPTPQATAARDQVVAALGYLGGGLLSQVAQAGGQGVVETLAAAGRPSLTYSIPQLNAFTVGQLIYLWQTQTAYAAELLDVNAYDQPAVDASATATEARLRQPAAGPDPR